jgi:hypothetical protein
MVEGLAQLGADFCSEVVSLLRICGCETEGDTGVKLPTGISSREVRVDLLTKWDTEPRLPMRPVS